MKDFHYLIIGGGMTADAAVKGIRSLDKKRSIAIISNDVHLPYSRPPLTKALWKGDDESTIWKKTDEHDVTIILSRNATHINPQNKTVKDDLGEEYSYSKLLLATGGVVNRLPLNAHGIIYYRTYDDYKTLREKTKVADHVIIVGGGFIGSEIAASLAMNDKKVTMIFPESGVGARNFPKVLSNFVTEYYKSKGVTVYTNDSVADIENDGDKFWVKTKNNHRLHGDAVVAGLGIKPNVELAEAIGLITKNGVEVNEFLQTSHEDIYAAGDVANFDSPHLGKRIRVEHEDNALTMGEMAGKNMAGGKEQYTHLPFFYSDLFDLGYEAVGELDARLETVEEWKDPFREGVVYYLEEGRVRGVLLWNTWGQVDHARELIATKDHFTAKKLKGLLPK
jgi:NADPH-dependent 2,4-dienoyl-CoA reductase/sulfur reductase-like enzyme